MTQLQGNITHGDWLNEACMVNASAAPPSPKGAGEQSADATAVSGGTDGFSLEESLEAEHSAWALCVGVTDFIPATLVDLVDAMDNIPNLEAAAMVAAITHASYVMRDVDKMAAPGDSVSLPVGDLLVLLRAAMKRVA